jgi:hypothetical protein
MTQSIFIAALQGLTITEDLGDGLDIIPHNRNENFPKIKLTNNLSFIQKYSHADFTEEIGLIEHRNLFDLAPAVVFSEGHFDNEKITDIAFLNRHLDLLRIFFHCLWAVKDNAVDYELGFLFYASPLGHGTASNQFTGANYNCTGTFANTEFSVQEINQATELLKKTFILEERRNPVIIKAPEVGKIAISNYFVQNARISSDLGIKIANYCSALETLFTNDITELSHKLAERVSLFLESEIEKRKDIFKVVKKAYDFRSKVVHGAMLDKKQLENFQTLTTKLDDICRRVVTYCYTTEDSDHVFMLSVDKQEEYFLNLIMS